MKLFDTISYSADKPCVVALGCFDGVHTGHAAVIRTAVDIAKKNSVPCLVFTFDEPPRNLFANDKTPLITTTQKKAELIGSLGADVLVCVPFTKEIASLSPEDFAKRVLADKLSAMHVVCGFNYTFGAKAMGNTDFLARFCSSEGIGLTVLPPFSNNGECVSSSLIRSLISSGDVERAAILLGRRYSISARVISDKGLAQKLGFPTANQLFDPKTLMPKNGVYASRALIDGRYLPAITNVGVRPTVNGSTLCAETHILDFSEDLYGKEIEIEFAGFIREERKFSSVSELREQVLRDINTVKNSDL